MKEFDDFRDLTGNDRELKCMYHGIHNPHLEGRIIDESKSSLVVGINLWEIDTPHHSYDGARKSLDIWYQPPPEDEARIDLLTIQEFIVPNDIEEINILDYDQLSILDVVE